MKRKVDLIVIHCSATRENTNYTFAQLIKDHQARGFNTCGYHRYIRRDGTIHIGRDFAKIGAHVSGSNSNSIGICYEGGLDSFSKPKDTRTPEQKKALLLCIADAINYGEVKRITGHRDLSPDLDGDGVIEPQEWVKSCPCFSAENEYRCMLNP